MRAAARPPGRRGGSPAGGGGGAGAGEVSPAPRPGLCCPAGGARPPASRGDGGSCCREIWGRGRVNLFPSPPPPPSPFPNFTALSGGRGAHGSHPHPPPLPPRPGPFPTGGPTVGLGRAGGLAFPSPFWGGGLIPEGDGCRSRLGVRGALLWAPWEEAQSAAPWFFFFLGALIMFFFRALQWCYFSGRVFALGGCT